METKLYYGSYEVWNTAFCLLNYAELEKECLHFPPPVTLPLPLCLNPHLLAAILRQQQVEKIIIYSLRSIDLSCRQMPNPHQQFKHIPQFHMPCIIQKQARSLLISILNNNKIFWECILRMYVGHVTENESIVFSLFLRNVHSDKRFFGTPPKKVLYLDIAK